MARKRLKESEWDEVRICMEIQGLSLGDIAKQFGVGKSTISEKATKEGWKKGGAVEHIESKKADIVKILATKPNALTNDNEPATERYNTAINKIVLGDLADEFWQEMQRLDFIKMGVEKAYNLMNSAEDGQAAKAATEAGINVGKLSGAIPFFAQATTINNTAQAAVVAEPKKLADFYGDS